MRNVAVITAAGKGSRMKTPVKKQYLNINGKPVLYWTLKVFEHCADISEIIIVAPRGHVTSTRDQIVEKYGFEKVSRVVVGGKRRQDSVAKGVRAIEGYCDVVCVHDGVRPLVDIKTISKSVRTAANFGASCVAVKVKDTIKQITDDGFIQFTPNRRYLYAAQTPQCFDYNLYMDAVAHGEKVGFEATDDCSLVEAIGGRIVIVEGSYENIKITTEEDLTLANQILKNR